MCHIYLSPKVWRKCEAAGKYARSSNKYISWDITIGSRKSLRRVYNYKPWQTQALQFWGLQVLQLFARTNLLVRKKRFNLVGLPSLHHCIERRMYQALPVDSSSPADRWKPPSWMLVRSTVRVVECTWTKVQACSLQKLFIACGSTCRMVESCCSHIWQKDLDFAAAACSIRTESLLSMTHLQGTLAYPKFPSCDFLLFESKSSQKSQPLQKWETRAREREREIVVYSTNHRFPRHQDISAFIGLWLWYSRKVCRAIF